jgi:integrase
MTRARERCRGTLVSFSFDQMPALALSAGAYETMVRVFALRLGEVLGLDRRDFDGEVVTVRGAAHNGVFTPGDQPTKRHVRRVPCPPSTAHLLKSLPTRIDTALMFPTLRGAHGGSATSTGTFGSPRRRDGPGSIALFRTPSGDVPSSSKAGLPAARLSPSLGHASAGIRNRPRRPSRGRWPHRGDCDRAVHAPIGPVR